MERVRRAPCVGPVGSCKVPRRRSTRDWVAAARPGRERPVQPRSGHEVPIAGFPSSWAFRSSIRKVIHRDERMGIRAHDREHTILFRALVVLAAVAVVRYLARSGDRGTAPAAAPRTPGQFLAREGRRGSDRRRSSRRPTEWPMLAARCGWGRSADRYHPSSGGPSPGWREGTGSSWARRACEPRTTSRAGASASTGPRSA